MLTMFKPVVLVVLLVFTIISPLSSQTDARNQMQAAEAAYQQRDYTTAITLYEAVLAAGYADYAVYFNLGNAYYEARQLGDALVNYRRAQRIRPRDPALTRHIALVQAQRVDFQGDSVVLVDQIATATRGTLSLLELGVLVLFVWSGWFGCVLLWVVFARWRARLLRLIVIGGVVLLIGLALLLPRAYADSQRVEGVVISLSAPVMSGPGVDYLEMFQLYSAAEFRVLEVQEGWARVLLPDARQGWVQGDFIALV